MRKQYNIYLPPEVIRAVKQASMQAGISQSRLVEAALRAYLEESTLGDRRRESEEKGGRS